jgi:hypothetical protein
VDNQQIFDKFVVELLHDLLIHFPKKQDYNIDQFTYLASEENRDVFFDSIAFLKDENIIGFSTQVYGGFLSVSLTGKGLALLNSTPSSLSKSITLANRLKDAVESGSREIYSTVLKELLKQATSTLLKKVADE